MTEEFLHYIWNFTKFDLKNLQTQDAQLIQVLKTGLHNTNAGPDFSDARIRIGETLWAGNVEIHIHSSDWDKHKHTGDSNYENVILHVVYEDDVPVSRQNGEPIPTLELKDRIPKELYGKYLQLITNKAWIPCEREIGTIPQLLQRSWLDRLLAQRMERKSTIIAETYLAINNDLNEAFYIHLAGNFGFKVNAEPFQRLARSLPYKVLSKHRNSLFQLEALLFGQAGLLEQDFADDYPNRLKQEYAILKSKYGLKTLPKHVWKFMRTRPSNFPSIRIAQFAKLLFQTSNLFSAFVEAKSSDDVLKLLQIELTDYWNNHYVFDKASKSRAKSIGKGARESIIINSVAPFLFVYANYKAAEHLKERGIACLSEIGVEQNSIISHFDELGVKSISAADTQALLELKNEHCNHKKCLTCAFGNHLLKTANT